MPGLCQEQFDAAISRLKSLGGKQVRLQDFEMSIPNYCAFP